MSEFTNNLFCDIPVENIAGKISEELQRLLKGVIAIEDFLKKNPPPEDSFQINNEPKNKTLDFYIPNFEDEPPIKRRRLDSKE
jgi:hypothetical protein